jgi:quinoprotein dehydrogenase-associated probable ABC transporter substrate-binding protein
MRKNCALDRLTPVLFAVFVACGASAAQVETDQVKSADHDALLRVCADPDNLPLSNDRGEGYENKIAERLAHDLKRRLEYTFFPQRIGFVRNTLRQKDPATQEFKCDVIIGVPKGYELTATTRPYMRSTYALLFPDRPEFKTLKIADDLLKLPPEKLRSLRIGLFGRSPGSDWLLRNNLMDRAAVYPAQSGDPHENPALMIDRDLKAGNIDMAIVWGPIAGFLVRNHSASPAWRAAPFTADRQIKFDYEISMGVRFGEKEWKDTLDQWITAHQKDVHDILASYLVPLLDEDGNLTPNPRTTEELRAGSDGQGIPLPLRQ